MSTMTEQTTQVYRVFIRATPEQVWDAITKPEFTTKYFHGSVLESDYTVGSSYRGRSADGTQEFVQGEVLAADPPRFLQTTWKAVWDPEMADEPAGRVTWEIEVVGESTMLTVVHDELAGAPRTAESVASAGGWSWVLSGLKSVLETGEGLGALSA